MTKREDLLTISPEELGKNPIEKAKEFFERNIGKNKLLIIDGENTLQGLITLSDVERISQEKGRNRMAQDSEHRLLAGAALPVWRKTDGNLDKEKIADHIARLIEK